MASRLRVARTRFLEEDAAQYGDKPVFEYFPHLHSLLKGKVPEVTLGLLALPKSSPDGKYREWYAGFSGQPAPLISLPDAARSAAETLLADRLKALLHQAWQLQEAGKAGEAEALRLICRPPQANMVYVVGGQPVIVDWDRKREAEEPKLPPDSAAPSPSPRPASSAPPQSAPQPETAPAVPSEQSVRSKTRIPLIPILLTVLILLAAGAFAAWRFQWLPPLDGLWSQSEESKEKDALLEEIKKLEDELKARLATCPSPVSQ